MPFTYIRRQFSDTVSYTDALNGGITNSALTFTLKSGTTFPNGSVGPFVVTIDPNTGTEEKILCLSRSGAVVTVQTGGRGFGGTTAVAHGNNASVIHTLCAQDLDEANQVVNNTLGQITTAGDLLYAGSSSTLTRLGIGAANTVLNSSGTAPQWSTILSVLETGFTSGNQIVWGTGSGTGALIALLTAIEQQFSAAGQIIVGTGSSTGKLLGSGTAGTVLSVGGADPSGLQWTYPGLTSASGHLSSNYSVTGSLATFLTTSSLAAGTWLVTFNCTAGLTTGSVIEVQAGAGSATATFEGTVSSEAVNAGPNSGEYTSIPLSFIATVTVAGTLVFQASGGTSNAILASTPTSTLAKATGYTALRIA